MIIIFDLIKLLLNFLLIIPDFLSSNLFAFLILFFLKLNIRTRFRVDITYKIGRHTSELQSPCNIVCRLLLEKNILGGRVDLGLYHIAAGFEDLFFDRGYYGGCDGGRRGVIKPWSSPARTVEDPMSRPGGACS